ncbi:hypothetical protein VTH06DRAFT_898 [Thermothelomyces fergusii]
MAANNKDNNNTTSTTPAATGPLGFMAKLSPCVYFYRPETPPSSAPPPSETSRPSGTAPPKLMVLATWMGAREPHIAKYLLEYRDLYPTSPILLLRSEPRHFICPGTAARDLAPAVPCVRSVFPDLGRPGAVGDPAAQDEAGQEEKKEEKEKEEEEEGQAQLLLHAWSNGGASSLVHLPTGPSRRAAGVALWAAAPLVHALCVAYWVRHVLLGRGRTDPLARLRRALNDAAARGAERRRTYVYGPADRLVDWRDVDAHAADARRAGFRVRAELFHGSEHVAHARLDPDRYWRAVRETWEGRAE